MHVKAFESVEELSSLLTTSVRNATLEVFSTMAYTEIDFINSSDGSNYSVSTGDISAIMTISNLEQDGLISVSMPLGLAKTVVGRLIGTEASDLEKEDYCDGIGELLNMVAGQVKMQLAHHSGEEFRLSLPSIIFGEEHTIGRRNAHHKCVRLVFEVEGQQFSVQTHFNSNEH